MATKRNIVEPSQDTGPSIDELLAQGDGAKITIDSPVIPGKKLVLEHNVFSGEDILNKTFVLPENERDQFYLTKNALAPLIREIRLYGQISPAIGRNTPKGVEVIFGSCRRMATHFADRSYHVLTCEDITDEEALALTESENTKIPISICEKGKKWKKHQQEGMNTREIAEIIEKGKVSHTTVALGIRAFELDKGVKTLYPALHLIGRATVPKLGKALEEKSAEEIVSHIKNEHAELLQQLNEDYEKDVEVSCKRLTDAIVEFTTPKVTPVKRAWPEMVSVNKDKKGTIENIQFNKALSQKQEEKLQDFLAKLLG